MKDSSFDAQGSGSYYFIILLVLQFGKWKYIFLSFAIFFFPDNLPSQIVLVCLWGICLYIFSDLSFRTNQIVPYKTNLITVLGDGLLQVLLPVDNMNIAHRV